MIFFKSCQRCSGDRSLENDYQGWYVLCLMCGHVTYPDVAAKPRRAAAEVRQAVSPERAEAVTPWQRWLERYRTSSAVAAGR